ncbi:unknown [Mycoplasma sp. CAG:611]|nr:unknown [Mycoplasma sp. CAG:611]
MKKADKNNSQKDYRWYSYSSTGEYKGMWANAVTVKDTNRQTYLSATPGTTISMDDITTMWVWIPRFNAVTPSNYNGGTKDNPGAIDVSFVKQNERAIDAFTFGNKELSGFWYGKFEVGGTHIPRFNAVTPSNYNGGTQSKPNAIDVTFVKQNETAIDAFTFGNKELSGFWYGKFEIGGSLASSCTNETCNVSNIVVKPNMTSLRSKKVSSYFFASRSMEQPNNSFGFINSEVDTFWK